MSRRINVTGPGGARQAAPPAESRCSASGAALKVSSETHKTLTPLAYKNLLLQGSPPWAGSRGARTRARTGTLRGPGPASGDTSAIMLPNSRS